MRNRTADQITTAIKALDAPLEPDTPESLIRIRTGDIVRTKAIANSLQAIVDSLNGSGGDQLTRTVLAREITRVHRYLQNELILTLLQTLGDLGALYQDRPVAFADARNEFAMRLCVKLRTCFADELFF